MKIKLYECANCGEKCKWEDVTEAPATTTGWLCHECFYIIHPEYLDFGELSNNYLDAQKKFFIDMKELTDNELLGIHDYLKEYEKTVKELTKQELQSNPNRLTNGGETV